MSRAEEPARDPGRERESSSDEEHTRSVSHEVEIEAPIEAVWDALTRAEELERWFPLEARVVPGEGGSIWMSWKNEYEGESAILAWEPPRLLRTTWGEPEGDQPGQVTTYTLESSGGSTTVRVVTSGFPTDSSWDEWVEGTRMGWRWELGSLKRYLEDHRGEDRTVAYLRRRAPVSREEAWSRLKEPEALGEDLLGGEPTDVDPPRQWAGVLDDPAGAYARVSMEPCMTDSDARDVTIFASAWGSPAADRLAEREPEWEEALERAFPEGSWPDRKPE
ncbi:MAG: SRPBCC domain-containing protein [Gemmatimonadota bacterium]|nr:SRPBCC domain-containing protein [Gemmatimonadota bacterium]